MTEWEWYGDTNCVRVFLHLILKANWKESTYQGVTIPRGSLVTGRKALSEQLGLSEREIRTALKRLTRCNSIDQQSTNKFSVVSVCNFDTYNPLGKLNDQPDANERPARRQQVTTSKEDNKKINIKKGFVLEVNCDEAKRKIIFKNAKGYFNGLDYDNAWDRFTWVCEKNNCKRTEARWTKYINNK